MKFSIVHLKEEVKIKINKFNNNPVIPVIKINIYGGNISISIKAFEYVIKNEVIPVNDINIINIGIKA